MPHWRKGRDLREISGRRSRGLLVVRLFNLPFELPHCLGVSTHHPKSRVRPETRLGDIAVHPIFGPLSGDSGRPLRAKSGLSLTAWRTGEAVICVTPFAPSQSKNSVAPPALDLRGEEFEEAIGRARARCGHERAPQAVNAMGWFMGVRSRQRQTSNDGLRRAQTRPARSKGGPTCSRQAR